MTAEHTSDKYLRTAREFEPVSDLLHEAGWRDLAAVFNNGNHTFWCSVLAPTAWAQLTLEQFSQRIGITQKDGSLIPNFITKMATLRDETTCPRFEYDGQLNQTILDRLSEIAASTLLNTRVKIRSLNCTYCRPV